MTDFNRFLTRTLASAPDAPAAHPGHPHEARGYTEHPRIAILRTVVHTLPVDEDYRAQLLQSLDTYRDQILERPAYQPDQGWDDLEALQQVTLGDMMERNLQALCNRKACERGDKS
jgi:hypothetical protein